MAVALDGGLLLGGGSLVFASVPDALGRLKGV